MRAKANISTHPDDDAVRFCLVPGADYSDLAALLHDLYNREHYRICIDLSGVSRLGTVEFRVLGSYAESCRRHGGFLSLENASAKVVALVRVFGFNELLAATPDQPSAQSFLSSLTQGG